MVFVGPFAACLVLATGCAGSEPPSENLDPPAWLREVAPGIDRASWIRMPDSQKDLLTDGSLEFDEYASAVRATAACLAAYGHEVSGPGPTADGMYMAWQASPDPSGALPPAALYANLSECETQHSAYIEILWGLMHPPSAEHIRQAQAAIETCMAEAGIEMPRIDSAEFDDWVQDGGRGLGSNRFGKCARMAAIETGLPHSLLTG